MSSASASTAHVSPLPPDEGSTPAAASPMIELDALCKRYGDFTALAGLSLRVERGEIFALLGPNGAGKTTTMRVLMGFLKPSAGSARIAGVDCFEGRVELKRTVGYLPDEPVFYDYLRGREIVEFSGEMHGLGRDAIRARANPLIERLELGDALADYAVNYSRGMKKKLALVCALLHQPELLILDEPTSGLDPLASRRLNELVVEYQSRGATVLLSSHLLDQVERLCQRVAIVHGGRIAAQGTLAELRRERAHAGTLEDIFFAVTAGASSAKSTEAATPPVAGQAGPSEKEAAAGAAAPDTDGAGPTGSRGPA